MLYYNAGDIILLGNKKFEDNNQIDVKTSKRPYIFLEDYCLFDEEALLVKLSTDENRYRSEPNRYYSLLPNNLNKLRRKSYVDLHYRYTDKSKSAKVIGRIDCKTLNKIKNLVQFKNI